MVCFVSRGCSEAQLYVFFTLDCNRSKVLFHIPLNVIHSMRLKKDEEMEHTSGAPEMAKNTFWCMYIMLMFMYE